MTTDTNAEPPDYFEGWGYDDDQTRYGDEGDVTPPDTCPHGYATPDEYCPRCGKP